MAAEPTIDYEALAQDALRGVVRTVLIQAAKTGLPGEHHFYISFDTGASGVVLSKRLKDKYPTEMTTVLQHRFWDLSVSDSGFEVKLTFDGIPERLVVPFAAIRVFFDPSVRYGLQFEDPNAAKVERDGLQAGDLVFFGSAPDKITHVGIYDADGRFINATTYQAPAVHEDRLDDPHWSAIYQGARRPR